MTGERRLARFSPASLRMPLVAVSPLPARQADSTLWQRKVIIQQDKVSTLKAEQAIAELAR